MSKKVDEQIIEATSEEVPAEAEPEQEFQPEPETQEMPAVTSNGVDFSAERGGVAWTDIWGKAKDDNGLLHLVKISLTNRADDAETALRGLLKALHVAKEEFKLTPYQPEFLTPRPANQAPVPELQPVTPIPGQPVQPPPPPAKAAVPVAPPAPAAPAGAAPAAKAEQTMAISKVEVKPRADGRVDVALYGPGRRFADLRMIGTPEQIAAKFGGAWLPAHFGPNVTTEYQVSLQAVWVFSDTKNSQGNPYKNVVRIG